MNATQPLTYGVSEFTTWPWTFKEDVARYSSLGVEAIEVCEFKLDWQHPARMTEQLHTITEAGLKITSVQPRLHSLFPDSPRPEPQAPADRMALYRQTIQRFADAGCAEGTVFVSITGAAPDADFKTAYATAAREYRELAKFAESYGAKIALEPLNPILMNADTFIVDIPSALKIVEEVDHPSFGIWIDVWHIFQDAGVHQHIASCNSKILGVHVNDWQTPRCFGDRFVIGDGQIWPQLPALLRSIQTTGYDGAYTLEIFSNDKLPDSLWRGDMASVITRSRAALQQAWSEALS